MSGIRIIAGEGRGRYLKTFKDDMSARPLLARIKKSVFDIIKDLLPGSRFLDLYAGTGAVGIEALSRGARQVEFVEMSPKFVGLVQENLKMLGWTNRAIVHKANIASGLKWLRKGFDVIYLGPPYKDENRTPLALTGPTLRSIVEAALLVPGGLIVGQHHDKEKIEIPEPLELVREEKYGDTIVSFYQYRHAE